jgi:hypothetical protein
MDEPRAGSRDVLHLGSNMVAPLENLLEYARILYFNMESSKLINYSTRQTF